ncbi:MAG: TolC family protein [Ferruginibacter sp.]
MKFLIATLFFYSWIMNSIPGQQRSLAYYIDQATTNSPLIRDFQNQIRINQFDSLLILAAQRPQVSFTGNESYAPVIGGYGYDKAITNGANLSALVGVSKSLLNGIGNRAQFANLKLLSDAIRNNSTITVQDIRRSIISQYILAYGDMVQVAFTKEIQHMLNRQDTVLKKLTGKNVYKQVDYLSFYVTLQQNEFKLKQQVILYQNDYAMLNYLAGIADTSQTALEKPDLSVAELPGIEQSAFFQKYYIDSLALVNNKTLIDIIYRPRLNVFADAGYNSSLEFTPYKNIGTSVGLSLVVPIYDGRQKKLAYSKIAVQEDTRVANREFFMKQYYQQVAQLKQQLQAATTLVSDIRVQLKYIETLIRMNEKLLQTGDVRIYDYIQALNNYLATRNLINENTITQLQLINQINYWSR